MNRPLEPDRWARVEALFQEALELPVAERDAFLARACAGDDALRREVASLLEASGSGLTERVSAVDRVARDLMDSTGSAAVGRRLGPWRLEEEIGRGGMGVVYRAVRVEGDFQQTVAVKVLPGALFSPDRAERFRNERRILAGLEHPNIARILDGGATPEGVPYVVMEYVDGLPVDEFVRGREMTVEARVWLFLALCDAVQYAHRNLVVHRDLKPSNILITPDGTPKLLDFGIAKLLEEGAADPEVTGTRIMTPRYASPEQLLGKPAATTSDVYSLGVVLYQLLAGVHPLGDGGEGGGGSVGSAEFIRRVLESDPAPPSVASRDRTLAGDLDTVVLKALRRDPEERYGAVTELADDLKRWLTGKPIAARPASLGYRARKFVGRNRGTVAGAALALLLLLTQTGLFLQRLARERDAARDQAERATRTLDFLTEVFRGADPFVSADPDASAREILAQGLSRLEGELAGEPEVQAEILSAVGSTYQNLGDLERAEAAFLQGITVREAAFGPASPELARGLSELGGLYIATGRLPTADSLLVRSLALRRSALPANHPELAVNLGQLGLLAGDVGDYPRGDSLFRAALTILEDPLEPRDALLATTLSNHGILLGDWGHLEEAEAQLTRALEVRREIFGDRHPEVAVASGHLARIRGQQGLLHGADTLFREILDWAPPLVGDGNGWVTTWLNNHASVLKDLGRTEEALKVQEEVLARRRTEASSPGDVATALNNLANLQGNLGRLAEAQASLEEALDINLRAFGEDHPSVATNLNNLATLSWRRREFRRAAELQARVLEMDRRQLGDDHEYVATDLTALGNYHLYAGELDRAGELLRQGMERMEELRGGDNLNTANARAAYADWLVAMGRGEEAESLARAALETRLALLEADDVTVAHARSTLGAALTLMGRLGEAEEELETAARIMAASLPEGDPTRVRNQARLEALQRLR